MFGSHDDDRVLVVDRVAQPVRQMPSSNNGAVDWKHRMRASRSHPGNTRIRIRLRVPVSCTPLLSNYPGGATITC